MQDLSDVEDLLNHRKIAESGWEADSSCSNKILLRELRNMLQAELNKDKNQLDNQISKDQSESDHIAKIIKKLKEQMDSIRQQEKMSLDSLALLHEELSSLRGEKRDIESDLDALHDELTAALLTYNDKKNYIADLQFRMHDFDGEIEKKKRQLIDL